MKTDTIYCGECSSVMREHIPDNSIDLTVTSPPYDNLRKYKGFVFPFEEIAQELYRVTKVGGVVVWVVKDATIKGSETGTSFRQALYFKEVGFNLHDTMIYHAVGPYPANVRYWHSFEYMFVFSKYSVRVFNPLLQEKQNFKNRANATFRSTQGTTAMLDNKGVVRLLRANANTHRVKDNIWYIPSGYKNTTKDAFAFAHPAVFPEKLAEDHILSWSNEGDTVFDPMCGSGTTLKMAQKHNRRYIGIDIAQEYVDLAHKRVSIALESNL